jgi:hypothetical protein
MCNFKLSDATLLAFKLNDTNGNDRWWRDTSKVPLKSIPLSKDLVLEPMVLDNSNGKKLPMFTSKLVDSRKKKTVLRVSFSGSGSLFYFFLLIIAILMTLFLI